LGNWDWPGVLKRGGWNEGEISELFARSKGLQGLQQFGFRLRRRIFSCLLLLHPKLDIPNKKAVLQKKKTV